jgi:hypothetical protein
MNSGVSDDEGGRRFIVGATTYARLMGKGPKRDRRAARRLTRLEPTAGPLPAEPGEVLLEWPEPASPPPPRVVVVDERAEALRALTRRLRALQRAELAAVEAVAAAREAGASWADVGAARGSDAASALRWYARRKPPGGRAPTEAPE